NIHLLSELGFLAHQISSKIGLGSSTVARVIKEIQLDKENLKMGHPYQPSSTSRRRIVSSVTSRRIENAIQATHIIRVALSSPSRPKLDTQTVCSVFNSTSLKAVVKQEKPLLSGKHKQQGLSFALKHQTWTGDWTRVI
ncbi:hypothetical protein M404DRAFT_170108, partial [Pisolithus tinctorius Marx 270]